MPFRTESEIILAANNAADLTNLVVAYLEHYRTALKNYKGYYYKKNIMHDVGTSKFSATIVAVTKNVVPCVQVSINWTNTVTTGTPMYYDVDDDNFSEAWGSDNISGYASSSSSYKHTKFIDIPVCHLLLNEANMKELLADMVTNWNDEEAEINRLEKIKKLEDELAALRK